MENAEQTQETSTETVEDQSTQAETQESPPETQAETTSDIGTNTEAVGISKPEESDEGEDFDVSGALSDLVSGALAGSLTDEQRDAIQKAGLDGHFDMIVAGHKAQQEANDKEIFDVVGGKESYSELQEWAIANLNDSEIESFNNAVLKSGDIGLAKLAVEGLQARYAKVNGQAPNKVIESGGTANEDSRAFSSVDDYINETMSLKYKQDPEYAAQVEAKRNLSGF